MRVLGLMLVLLVGPQLVPNDRHGTHPLRLAYADNSAFRSSFDQQSTARPLIFVAIDQRVSTRQEPTLIAALVPETPQRDRQPTMHELSLVPEPEDLRTPLSQGQRLSALSQPMHLLSSVAPSEEITAKTAPVASDSGKKARPRAHSRRRIPRARRHSSAAARRTARRRSAKVPRWAEQMFVRQWQSRAFAYQ